MSKILWGAIAIYAAMLALSAVPARAQGWDYFARHVHPTGKCGMGREVGASFYNDGYRTASGERFVHSALTAASNMPGGWPIGAHVTINNPRNGRSVAIRVNDILPDRPSSRCPHCGEAWRAGVRLDLSPAAFQALGMRQSDWVCAL